MPRRAKPQQPTAPTGQDYGDNQAQIQAQKAIPLPNVHGASGAPSASPPQGAPAGPPTDPLAAAVAAAAGGNFQVDSAPWAAGAMNEEVTAGLVSGPGPGPEILNQPRRPGLADTLMEIAHTTGDPLYADLAQLAAAGDL